MKLHYVPRKFVSHVELLKDGTTPIGLSVKGSSRCRLRPTIKSVKPRSLAHRSYGVSEGDVLLSVCGRETRAMSENDVRRLIRAAESRVQLQLECHILEPCFSSFGLYRVRQLAVRLRRDRGNFGFVLRKNGLTLAVCTEYPLVDSVAKDGPAGRDGRLRAGDRLLEIDGQSLSWLSLNEIADILLSTEEATFLVEYNICIADSHIQNGEVTDLVIDCPDADLGMTLSTTHREGLRMVVGDIRQGSLAERCGAFHIGDVILYINDVATDLLTIPKAASVLQRFKKEPGKLTYIPTMENCKRPRADTYLLQQASQSDSDAEQRCQRLPSLRNKHFNSPSSLYRPFLEKNDPSSENYVTVFHDFQIKTLSLCQEMIQNAANLQNLVPFLESHTDNSMEENTIPMDTTGIDHHKLSQLKASCTRMNDSALAIVLHLTRHTTAVPSRRDSSSLVASKMTKMTPSVEVTLKELSENLTEIRKRVLLPVHWVRDFSGGIAEVGVDCRDCHETVLGALLTTQKVVLLLTLSEQTAEVRLACNQLLTDLAQMTVPCEDCSVFATRPRGGRSSLRAKKPRVCVTTSSSSSNHSTGSSDGQGPRVGLDIGARSARYTASLTPNSSPQDGSSSGTLTDQGSTRALVPNVPETDENSAGTANSNSNDFSRKVHKQKGLARLPRLSWKSAEVISCTKSDGDEQPFLLSKSFTEKRSSTPKGGNAAMSSSPDERSRRRESERRRSSCRSPEMADSRINVANSHCIDNRLHPSMSYKSNIRTQSSTVEVKLKNSGKGFGLFLGYLKPSAFNHCQLPVVTALQSLSPAYKSGVLQIGDRVLEMNGQSMIGLPLRDLESLKMEAFAHDQMVLLVEFDVVKRDVRYGTFDVTIDKTVRTGLEFRDFRDGQPLVVKGVVKGSSAHRSGLVHPGDQILFTNCVRQESFDSVKSLYEKKSMVTMTIRREPPQTEIPDDIVDPVPKVTDGPPMFVRGDRVFNVNRTSIHCLEGSEALVLEHEVTLYRNPVLCDFGFLLEHCAGSGQVRVTGIRPDGPADASRVIKKHDTILEVNEVKLEGYKGESIMSLLRQTGDCLKLRTRRTLHHRHEFDIHA